MSYAQPAIAVITADSERFSLVRQSLAASAGTARIVQVPDVERILDGLSPANATRREPVAVPQLIVLDGWPDPGSVTALKKIRATDSLTGARVIVLAAADTTADVALAYRLGASSCLAVSTDADEFVACMTQAGKYWLLLNRWPAW